MKAWVTSPFFSSVSTAVVQERSLIWALLMVKQTRSRKVPK